MENILILVVCEKVHSILPRTDGRDWNDPETKRNRLPYPTWSSQAKQPTKPSQQASNEATSAAHKDFGGIGRHRGSSHLMIAVWETTSPHPTFWQESPYDRRHHLFPHHLRRRIKSVSATRRDATVAGVARWMPYGIHPRICAVPTNVPH